jgi:uncharacterized protein with PIN domain
VVLIYHKLIKKDKHITIRFYAELNDFLPTDKKKTPYNLHFFGSPTVKDIIESQGVPHAEIDLILVNGVSVDFQYRIEPLDEVSVYPEFELLDVSPLIRLRPKPLRNTRFVADAHLGKLARYLRMLGFDTVYKNDIRDDVIMRHSIEEQRIILTRDLGILKNGQVDRGYFIRNQRPFDQCREVIRKFSLEKQVSPFSRCIECNGLFNKVDKKLLQGEIPEMAYQYFEDFYRCTGCGNIYWKGSHYDEMQKTIQKLLSR